MEAKSVQIPAKISNTIVQVTAPHVSIWSDVATSWSVVAAVNLLGQLPGRAFNTAFFLSDCTASQLPGDHGWKAPVAY